MTIWEELKDDLDIAEVEAAESHKEAMNSYGAGYDRGFVDGLKRALAANKELTKTHG